MGVVKTLIAAGLFVLAATAPAHAQGQQRYAAVIGVENYPEAIGAAPGAAADAALIADTLREEGFIVTLEIDADQAALKRSVFWLNEQLASAGPDAVGVFYFAGHGVGLDGRSFLLVADTRVNDPLAASGSAIDVGFVVERLNASSNAPNFVFVDASGPNGLIDRFNLNPGLTSITPPDGGMAILSNQPSRLSPARQPGASTFARGVADMLKSGESRFSNTLRTLRDWVARASNDARDVWVAGRVPESFRFRSTATDDAPPQETVALQSAPPDTAESAPPRVSAGGRSDNTHLVEVFFGTDRAVRMENGRPKFLSEAAPLLSFGVASVSIPTSDGDTEIDAPNWWRFEFIPDPKRNVNFRDASIREEDAFFDALDASLAKSEGGEAFVFVHGFNTDFEAAARRTAQLHHELQFDGAPIFFSWPSRGEGTPLAYNRDSTAADRSAVKLARFLNLVAERTNAERIHLIGHGLGDRVLVQALDNLAEDAETGPPIGFGEVVLSAPDIERGVYLETAPRIVSLAERVTAYVSRNDQSLRASRSWSSYARAGDASEGAALADGVDTIDASSVRTELFSGGHDYFSTDRSVLDDLRVLLHTGAGPDERGLELRQHPPDGERYWIMR